MMVRDELYAVLVSLASDTLLLPNAAVAEVVSPESMDDAPPGAPAWFAGKATYNNRQLSVVRFEVMNGSSATGDTKRTRLAIVHALTERVRAGQYAVVCQGYPHLVTLNRNALRKEPLVATDQEEQLLSEVRDMLELG